MSCDVSGEAFMRLVLGFARQLVKQVLLCAAASKL